MKTYKIEEKFFKGIKIPKENLREAIPAKKYEHLVRIFQDIVEGYTAPAYDIVYAIEDAITRKRHKEGVSRKDIKKERNKFLKRMSSYIEQRIKMDLQTLG